MPDPVRSQRERAATTGRARSLLSTGQLSGDVLQLGGHPADVTVPTMTDPEPAVGTSPASLTEPEARSAPP